MYVCINAIVEITRPLNLPLSTLPQYVHTIKIVQLKHLHLCVVVSITASRKLIYTEDDGVLEFEV